MIADNARYRLIWAISNREFVVVIRAMPYAEVKGEVERWFIDQGFSSNALCEIRLFFFASSELYEAGYRHSAEDNVPTGCPVS